MATNKKISMVFFLVILITGICAVSAAQVRVSGSASVHLPAPPVPVVVAPVPPPPPSMVFIGPGVWVIENHSEPVFFHSDYYWSYRHGVWYRSHYHNSGWVRVHAVPPHLVRIKRPGRYVRYRAPKSHKRRAVVIHKHRHKKSRSVGHHGGYKSGPRPHKKSGHHGYKHSHKYKGKHGKKHHKKSHRGPGKRKR